jgi:hypothetical protein
MKYALAHRAKLLVIAAGLAAIGGGIYGGSVFASHSFEAGVANNSIPQNTHIRLDGLTLPQGGVLPVYDVPTVTVVAGHIDESEHGTFVDKVPLFYIDHASTAGSCVWHAHIPDPLNGGPARITDIDLINLSGQDVAFKPGDAADINVQRVLGSINESPYAQMQLPSNVTHGNPVFDLNDNSTDNDGSGFHGTS